MEFVGEGIAGAQNLAPGDNPGIGDFRFANVE